MRGRLVGSLGFVVLAVAACGGANAPMMSHASGAARPQAPPATPAGSTDTGAGMVAPSDTSAAASPAPGGGGADDDVPPPPPTSSDQEAPVGGARAATAGAPSDTAALGGSSNAIPIPPPGPSSAGRSPTPPPAACRVPALPATAPSAADRAQAQALFDEARRLMDQGKYAEACPKLVACEKLDPAVGTLLDLAACEEKKGDLSAARAHYEDACGLATSRNQSDRVAFARQKMAAIDAQLARQRPNF